MIRLWLIILIAVGVGALAAFFMRVDTGYVLLHYRGWSVETSVMALFVVMVLGVPIVLYLLRSVFGVLRLPSAISEAVERRRIDKARRSFESGMLKLMEGNWRQAEIELVRRAADHHAPHLNYLAAARAAQRMGADDRRDHYLQLAGRDSPALAFASDLTDAELQRDRGDYQDVRSTALKLHEAKPKHPYPVELLAEAHFALGEWEELHGLLRRTEKLNSPPPARRREMLQKALFERMQVAVEAARLEDLKGLWRQTPDHLRNDPALRSQYVHGLVRLNAHGEANDLISKTLAREWDPDLVKVFGELHTKDSLGQLASIEQWLSQYGEKPELLITAGRACLANKLWGKARSYLESAVRIQPTPAAYLELARLCEQTQNSEEAAGFMRKGLELASR